MSAFGLAARALAALAGPTQATAMELLVDTLTGVLWTKDVTLANSGAAPLNVTATDPALTFRGGGTGTTGASAKAVGSSGLSGPGYLTISNTDAAQALFFGLTPASSSSPSLAPGQSRTVRYVDVSTIYVFGSSGAYSWVVES